MLPLFFITLTLITAAIMCLISSILNKKSTKILDDLSHSLNGKTRKFLTFLVSFPIFTGEYEGFKFKIRLFLKNKNSRRSIPSVLTVSLTKVSSLKINIFSIRKPLEWDLSVRFKIDIKDEEYAGLRIFANDKIRVINYLKDEQIKTAVQALISKGFSKISITGREIEAEKLFYDSDNEDLSAERMIEVLKVITTLTRKI